MGRWTSDDLRVASYWTLTIVDLAERPFDLEERDIAVSGPRSQRRGRSRQDDDCEVCVAVLWNDAWTRRGDSELLHVVALLLAVVKPMRRGRAKTR